MEERTGTERLWDCPRSNLFLPQGPPCGWACTCPFLTWNHLKVIGHVAALNYNGSSYLPLLLFLKCHLSFGWGSFPLHRLQLCALAFNCDSDNGFFCKVIKPKSVVFSNLQWIMNVRDNPQALHTLQQRGWRYSQASERKLSNRRKACPHPRKTHATDGIPWFLQPPCQQYSW